MYMRQELERLLQPPCWLNYDNTVALITFRDIDIMLQPLNKQNAQKSSKGRQPVGFFVIGRFPFSRR